jgi:hypothetical protein
MLSHNAINHQLTQITVASTTPMSTIACCKDRWRSPRQLAHAVLIARHRLHDDKLALRYAQALALHTGKQVPSWARQMHIFILEDMGEVENAKILLGGLLSSHTLTDPHEVIFLSRRLNEMEKKIADKSSSMPRSRR